MPRTVCKTQSATRARSAWHADRRLVLLYICTKVPLQPEVDATIGVLAGIFGPHTGEFLTNGVDCVRFCFRCHRFAAGGDSSVPVTESKDLEVVDFVSGIPEERVDTVFKAVLMPRVPMAILFSSVGFSNASFDLLRASNEIRLEYIGRGRVHNCHGSACG